MPPKKKISPANNVIKIDASNIERYIAQITPKLESITLDESLNIFETIVKLEHNDFKFLVKWSNHISSLLQQSTPEQISQIIKGCGALLLDIPTLTENCINLTLNNINNYNTKQLTTIITGLAKLDYYHEELMEKSTIALSNSKLNNADTQDLSSIIWSCAKLRYQDDSFANIWLTKAIEITKTFTTTDLSKSIQGIAKLGYYDETFISEWINRARELDIREFSSTEKLNNSYYLTMIKTNGADHDMKSALDNLIADLLSELPVKDVINIEDKRQLLMSFKQLNESKQNLLTPKFDTKQLTKDIQVRSEIYVSNTQAKAFQTVENIHGIKATSERWLEEILNHVDIYIEDLKAIIQIDGHPSHYYRNGKPTSTTIFNSNIATNANYNILRIKDSDGCKKIVKKFLSDLWKSKRSLESLGTEYKETQEEKDSNPFELLDNEHDTLDNTSDTILAIPRTLSSPNKPAQSDDDVMKEAILDNQTRSDIHKALYRAVIQSNLNDITHYKAYIKDCPHPLVAGAVNNNKIEIVKTLLKHHVNLDIKTNAGDTAIHIATSKGMSEIVEMLLEHGANPNLTKKDGNSAIHIAIVKENFEIFKLLTDHGARLNILNNEGVSPSELFQRPNFDQTTNTQELEKYFKSNCHKIFMCFLKLQSSNNISLSWSSKLSYASNTGDIGMIENLLLTPTTSNKFEKNYSLIMAALTATIHDFTEIVQLILKNNKEFKKTQYNENKIKLLHVAIYFNRYAITELLLKYQPSLATEGDKEYGSVSLHKAVKFGHYQIVELLLQSEPKLSTMVDNEGFTALHIAVEFRHYEITKLLLQSAPTLATMVDNEEITALHIAAKCGHHQIVELLLQSEPKLSTMVDNRGLTALHIAVEFMHYEITKLLLQSAPTLATMVDNEGITALHIAAEVGHYKIVELLLQFEPTLATMVNKQECTALHGSAQEGHYEIAELLLTSAPTLATMVTKDKATALHYAAQQGHYETAKLLLESAPTLAKMVTATNSTALGIAAQKNHYKILELLLQFELKLKTIVTETNSTALDMATQKKHYKIVELLSNKVCEDTKEVTEELTDRIYADIDLLNNINPTPADTDVTIVGDNTTDGTL